MIINMNMNLKKEVLIGFDQHLPQELSWNCSHLIISSIIFPMEICRVPRDSWAGRMYASRVKLSMLVTANSTSEMSCGSSWCQLSRTARHFQPLKTSSATLLITNCFISHAHLCRWSKYTPLCRCGPGRGSNPWAWLALVKQRMPGTCWAPSCPGSSTSPESNSAAPRSTLPYIHTRKILHKTKQHEQQSQIWTVSVYLWRRSSRPTDHPHHVEGAVENVLLAGGKIVSIQLHHYRLSEQCDEKPQIGRGVEKEFNHRDLQDLSGLVKRCRYSGMCLGI